MGAFIGSLGGAAEHSGISLRNVTVEPNFLAELVKENIFSQYKVFLAYYRELGCQ